MSIVSQGLPSTQDIPCIQCVFAGSCKSLYPVVSPTAPRHLPTPAQVQPADYIKEAFRTAWLSHLLASEHINTVPRAVFCYCRQHDINHICKAGLQATFCAFHSELPVLMGAHASVVLKALCYKQEGRGFEIRWGELISSIYLIPPAALSTGFTQPLREMNTRSI
jgi:hypothetical protein